MSKEFKDWTYEEVVTNAGELVLQSLMKGEFRDGVSRAVHMVANWSSEQPRNTRLVYVVFRIQFRLRDPAKQVAQLRRLTKALGLVTVNPHEAFGTKTVGDTGTINLLIHGDNEFHLLGTASTNEDQLLVAKKYASVLKTIKANKFPVISAVTIFK